MQIQIQDGENNLRQRKKLLNYFHDTTEASLGAWRSLVVYRYRYTVSNFPTVDFFLKICVLRNQDSTDCMGVLWIRIAFNEDPDRVFQVPGSGFRVLKTKNCKILMLKKIQFIPFCLHEGRPRYRRSLQLSKETISTSLPEISALFSIFFGSYLPSTLLNGQKSLKPDPD